jgi:hypothetical protein
MKSRLKLIGLSLLAGKTPQLDKLAKGNYA